MLGREEKSSWEKPLSEPSEDQTKVLVCMAIRKATEARLKGHDYSYDGKIHGQENKGVIGPDLQRCICNIYITELCRLAQDSQDVRLGVCSMS